MDTRRYLALETIVKRGNMTKAAEELGYTQSALSQMIGSLESEMGFRILNRSRSGCELTLEGKRLYPLVEKVLSADQALNERAAEINGLESGTVRMGTVASVSAHWLPPLIREFEQKHPHVQFIIHQGDYSLIPEWIKQGKVDFGFINPLCGTTLKAEPLKTAPMSAVLPKDHHLANLPTIPLADLAKEPFILLEEGNYSEPLEAFRTAGLSPNIKYTIHDDYSIMSMVEQGLGISIMADLIMKKCPYELVKRPTDPPVLRTMALVYENESKLPIASKRFIELVREYKDDLP